MPGCLLPKAGDSTSATNDTPARVAAMSLLSSPPPPPEIPLGALPPGVLYVALDITRVELPMDEVRDSRKVWNHVDEMRAGPDAAVRLARNGVRIGVGRPQSWPAIRAILEASSAKLSTDQIYSPAGDSVSLKIASSLEGESIFVYGSDDKLSGRSFPAGEKLLNFQFKPAAETGGSLELRPTFEVRQDLGVMTWDTSGGGIREVPEYNRHVFEGLGGAVFLASGEFLVIGLGETADKPYLLGNRFLTQWRGPQSFETLLFLSPRTLGSAPPS